MSAAPALADEQPSPASSPAAGLRNRLLEMRARLVEDLAASPHIDGGHLALLGHVGAALRALDDMAPAARVAEAAAAISPSGGHYCQGSAPDRDVRAS